MNNEPRTYTIELTAEDFHELEEHGMSDDGLNQLRKHGLTFISWLNDKDFGILISQLEAWSKRDE